LSLFCLRLSRPCSVTSLFSRSRPCSVGLVLVQSKREKQTQPGQQNAEQSWPGLKQSPYNNPGRTILASFPRKKCGRIWMKIWSSVAWGTFNWNWRPCSCRVKIPCVTERDRDAARPAFRISSQWKKCKTNSESSQKTGIAARLCDLLSEKTPPLATPQDCLRPPYFPLPLQNYLV
jgi:hypothetical protein